MGDSKAQQHKALPREPRAEQADPPTVQTTPSQSPLEVEQAAASVKRKGGGGMGCLSGRFMTVVHDFMTVLTRSYLLSFLKF